MSEPARTTVVDSLTQFGGTLSMSEASRAYGVPVGTIKRWAKERREGKEPAEVVRLVTAPPAPEPVRVRATPATPGHVRATPAADLPDQVREQLTKAVDAGLDYLAGGPGADPKGWASAANGVRLILMTTPDLLTFRERTAAPGDADQLADAGAVRAELLRRRRG